jgi:hypothetical protein
MESKLLNLNYINKKTRNKKNPINRLSNFAIKNKDKIIKQYKMKLRLLKKELIKNNIYNEVKRFTKQSTIRVKKSVDKYDKDISNREKFVKIGTTIKNEIIEIKNFSETLQLKSNNKKNIKEASNTSYSIFTLVFVIILNTLFLNIIYMITLNPIMALALTALLCAPIIEEIAKKISIEKGYDEIYVPMFIWTEYVMYVIPAMFIFLPLGLIMMLVRLIPVFMHYTTYDIQKTYAEKNDGKVPKKILLMAICVHFLYNFASVLGILHSGIAVCGISAAWNQIKLSLVNGAIFSK